MVKTSERDRWLSRLAAARPDQIASLLDERRQALIATDPLDDGSELDRPAEPSVQQIILTEPNSNSPEAADAVIEPAADSKAFEHPLLSKDRLEAPRPGSSRAPAVEEPAGEVTPAEHRGFVGAVYDAFGVGGETLAARREVEGTTSIQLAEEDEAEPTSPADAEEMVRDLKAAQFRQSVFWQEDLDKLITLLEAQVAQQQPGGSPVTRELYIRQHVALRMLYLIASRRAEALQAIPSLPHDAQEFWTQMFWALASTFDDEAMPHSEIRAAATVAQLRAAIRQLAPHAQLDLQRTLFCRQIDGFGKFEAFEEDRFDPGQPVLIYTEVRNFQSQPTADGDFRTVLQSKITIREGNLTGPVVFEYELPQTEDRCLSRRQDYFHSYRIHLPQDLNPGPHVLTLEVLDGLSAKAGSSTMHFLVN